MKNCLLLLFACLLCHLAQSQRRFTNPAPRPGGGAFRRVPPPPPPSPSPAPSPTPAPAAPRADDGNRKDTPQAGIDMNGLIRGRSILLHARPEESEGRSGHSGNDNSHDRSDNNSHGRSDGSLQDRKDGNSHNRSDGNSHDGSDENSKERDEKGRARYDSFWITAAPHLLKIGGIGVREPALGALNIDSLGNIGVGAVSAGAPLQIGRTALQGGSPYPSSTLLAVFQPVNTSILGASIDIGMGKAHGRITGYGSAGDNNLGQMAFSTMVRGIMLEAMRIDSNGNIGIGTSVPKAKLDVNGGASFIGENHLSVGTFTDPAPGVNYALKIGGGGIAVNGNAVFPNGVVGIGTLDTKGYALAVNGSAIFTNIVVKLYRNWPDYVFKKGYALPDLSEVKKYIRKYNHLPGILSAREAQQDGINLGENQAALLKKVEELTLYLIRENDTLKEQCRQMKEQNARLDRQQAEIDELRALIKAQGKHQ